MTIAALALVFVVGVMLGALWQRPTRRTAEAPRAVPPPVESRARGRAASAFRASAVEIAEAPAEVRAVAIEELALGAWERGVSDLRDAMIEGSGLPTDLSEDITSHAIVSLIGSPR